MYLTSALKAIAFCQRACGHGHRQSHLRSTWRRSEEGMQLNILMQAKWMVVQLGVGRKLWKAVRRMLWQK
eukprot:2523270-Amphidinium_carterae.1